MNILKNKLILSFIISFFLLALFLIAFIFIRYNNTVTKDYIESISFKKDITNKINTLTGLNLSFKTIISDDKLNFTMTDVKLNSEIKNSPKCEIDRIKGKINNSLLYLDLSKIEFLNPKCNISTDKNINLLGIKSNYNFNLTDLNMIFGAKIDNASLINLNLDINVIDENIQSRFYNFKNIDILASMYMSLNTWNLSIKSDSKNPFEIIANDQKFIKALGSVNISLNDKFKNLFDIDLKIKDQNFINLFDINSNLHIKTKIKSNNLNNFLIDDVNFSSKETGNIDLKGKFNILANHFKFDIEKVNISKGESDLYKFKDEVFKFILKDFHLKGKFSNSDKILTLKLVDLDKLFIKQHNTQKDIKKKFVIYLKSNIEFDLYKNLKSVLNINIDNKKSVPFNLEAKMYSNDLSFDNIEIKKMSLDIKEILKLKSNGILKKSDENISLNLDINSDILFNDLEDKINLSNSNIKFDFSENSNNLHLNIDTVNYKNFEIKDASINLIADIKNIYDLGLTSNLHFKKIISDKYDLNINDQKIKFEGSLLNYNKLYITKLNLDSSLNKANFYGDILFADISTLNIKGDIKQKLDIFNPFNLKLSGDISGPVEIKSLQDKSIDFNFNFNANISQMENDIFKMIDATVKVPIKFNLINGLSSDVFMSLDENLIQKEYYDKFTNVDINADLNIGEFIYKNKFDSKFKNISSSNISIKSNYLYLNGQNPKSKHQIEFDKIFFTTENDKKEMLDLNASVDVNPIHYETAIDFDINTVFQVKNYGLKNKINSLISVDKNKLYNFKVKDIEIKNINFDNQNINFDTNGYFKLADDYLKFEFKANNSNLSVKGNSKAFSNISMNGKDIFISGNFFEDEKNMNLDIKLSKFLDIVLNKEFENEKHSYKTNLGGNINLNIYKDLKFISDIDVNITNQSFWPNLDTKTYPINLKANFTKKEDIKISNISLYFKNLLNVKSNGFLNFKDESINLSLENMNLKTYPNIRSFLGFDNIDKPIIETDNLSLNLVWNQDTYDLYDTDIDILIPKIVFNISEKDYLNIKKLNLDLNIDSTKGYYNIPFKLQGDMDEIIHPKLKFLLEKQKIFAEGNISQVNLLNLYKFVIKSQDNKSLTDIVGSIKFTPDRLIPNLIGNTKHPLSLLKLDGIEIDGHVRGPFSIKTQKDDVHINLNLFGKLNSFKHENLEIINSNFKWPINMSINKGISSKLLENFLPNNILDEYFSKFKYLNSNLEIKSKNIKFMADGKSENIVEIPNSKFNINYNYDFEKDVDFGGTYEINQISGPRADGKGKQDFVLNAKGNWERIISKDDLKIRLISDIWTKNSIKINSQADILFKDNNLNIDYKIKGPLFNFISESKLSKLPFRSEYVDISGKSVLNNFYKNINYEDWSSLKVLYLPFIGNISGNSKITIKDIYIKHNKNYSIKAPDLSFDLNYKGDTDKQIFNGKLFSKNLNISTENDLFKLKDVDSNIKINLLLPLPSDKTDIYLNGSVSQIQTGEKTNKDQNFKLDIDISDNGQKIDVKFIEINGNKLILK